MTHGVSIRREAVISAAINGVLSLAFFLGMFGMQARPLAWGLPDGLAMDFVPQSIAVALMSALVPALIARRKLGNVPEWRGKLLWAGAFALAGGALGALIAWSIGTAAFSPIAWASALIMKVAYGGALGALVATWALLRLQSAA